MTTNVLRLFQGKTPTENKALTPVTFAEVQSALEHWSASICQLNSSALNAERKQSKLGVQVALAWFIF